LFSLIVGFLDGQVSAERMLEYTDDTMRQYIAPAGAVDLSRLRNLPTLLMPELQDSSSPQIARIGTVEDLTVAGSTYRFRFVPNPGIPEIDTARIDDLAVALQIDRWEFNRHHWAVKDVDLYRIIHESILSPHMKPTVFRLPTSLPIEPDLVAVMMPFSADFEPVYASLSDAAKAARMRCLRADDIWVNDHIMDDVINLLWRARVVIADLTGKNPNVFYETGIAHTLGRDVIQITQSMDDVPFDLRSIRTVTYLNNNEGRDDLRTRVRARLTDLAATG
jgi:hypothetical protein